MSNLKEKLTKGGATTVIVITILAVCLVGLLHVE